LRLEIGPKDIEKNAVFAARRDTREKQSIPMDGLADRIHVLLTEIQASLLARAGITVPRRWPHVDAR
jgi:prolyl-tRNA synthetase